MSAWRLDPAVDHLNHGSFGATPTAALAAQQRWRDLLETNPCRFMLEQYQPALDAARIGVAEFVGADAAGLVFVDNATAGVNAVLRSLEPTLRASDEIVITDHTYNACRNAAFWAAERTGARVVTATFPFPIDGPARARDAILAAVTERTRLVMIDAVTSPTGLIVPFAEIVEALEPDVPVLIDAAHAPGMIEFDVSAIGASYVTANCHKWMCAPKGAGFLHVRADKRVGIYPSVISHGFNGGWPGTGGHLHTQFDWTGTDDPTAWLSVPAALDAVASLRPDGWAGVRRSNHELVLAGRQVLLDALGLGPPAPAAMIGSIASVPLPDPPRPSSDIFDPLMIALRRRWDIEVPVFAWPETPNRLVRISAQLYNRLEQYERLAEALVDELAREH